MSKMKTYLLRLPCSLKKAVEQQSKEDGTSINQFVATAVAEKLSAMPTAEFFASRKAVLTTRRLTSSWAVAGASGRVPAMNCRRALNSKKEKAERNTFGRD
jgi:hypothetical protein